MPAKIKKTTTVVEKVISTPVKKKKSTSKPKSTSKATNPKSTGKTSKKKKIKNDIIKTVTTQTKKDGTVIKTIKGTK